MIALRVNPRGSASPAPDEKEKGLECHFASSLGTFSIVYRGNIGRMEEKMEATIVYWGNIGLMQKKMEATIVVPGSSNC